MMRMQLHTRIGGSRPSTDVAGLAYHGEKHYCPAISYVYIYIIYIYIAMEHDHLQYL